ncbi:MAG: hypothetical protein EPN33_05360 [Acidobacteria bacterium]|nr:MAG: hypothetical protein EPN33_05360 [Acidobacteriota bacterium]
MDGVAANPPSAAEAGWADLDREWAEFWAALERHTHDYAIWFTPAHASVLQRLLDRSQQWRQQSEPQRDADARSLYAAHLRRLAPVLRDLQRSLLETTEHLLRQRESIRAKREWARQQARPPARVPPHAAAAAHK